jgi:hypothetical protein
VEIRREPGAQLVEALKTSEQSIFEIVLASAPYRYTGGCTIGA